MGDTVAERKRRSRAHKADDHSLCVPGRCNPDTVGKTVPRVTVTPVTPQPRASRLNAPGRQLWADHKGDDLTGADRVLLIEACRITDRLDRLDRILTGDEDAWLRLSPPDDGGTVTVLVDKPLSEARQQSLALRAILAELRANRAAAQPAAEPEPAATGSVGEASNLVDFDAYLSRR